MPNYCNVCHVIRAQGCEAYAHPAPRNGVKCEVCGLAAATIECSEASARVPRATAPPTSSASPTSDTRDLLGKVAQTLQTLIGSLSAAGVDPEAVGQQIGAAIVMRIGSWIDRGASAWLDAQRARCVADLASAYAALVEVEEADLAAEVRGELASYYAKDPEAQA